MSGAYLLGSSPPVFSSYSTNLYNLTLEMVERRQLHMHTRNFIFLFFCLLHLRGGDRPHHPPGYATAHQCCIFQCYAKTVPSRMKLTMHEPASMTTDTWSWRVTSDFNSALVGLCCSSYFCPFVICSSLVEKKGKFPFDY